MSKGPILRADFGSAEELAFEVGQNKDFSARPENYRSFNRRLVKLEQTLRGMLRRFMSETDAPIRQARAVEWFLDNDYRLQEAAKQVLKTISRGFLRHLPTFASGPFAGRARVYALARISVESSKGAVEIDWLARFLRAYPHPLTIGEIWAFPAMLRLAVLEMLADEGTRLFEFYASESGPLESAVRAQVTEYEGDIINCISSLHRFAAQDWKQFFESVSRVDAILEKDPANDYAGMDFESRNHYREEVERLSRQTGKLEEEVAASAIELARETTDASSRRRHVGYFLIDSGGRQALEQSLGYDLPWHYLLARFFFLRPLLPYVGGILGATLLLTIALCAYSAQSGPLSGAGLLATAFLVITPASIFAFELINFLTAVAVKPAFILKMDLRRGIPDHCRTLVAVPSLLGDIEEVASLLRKIEVHYLGNQDPNLYFALLTGFKDSFVESPPGDAYLMKSAKRGIRALNKKYGSGGRGPFLHFHRESLWNPSQGRWMGWERKRGILREFNQLILGSEIRSRHTGEGDFAVLPSLRFVITMDADTVLPPGASKQLIGAMAHPLNRARYDVRADRVTSGYTILQPRIEVDPTSVFRTRFSRIFAGEKGLNLYGHAVSDVYQDLFAEGNYAGKGIYEIATFEESLRGKAPENTLLSHDLFEGLQGRAGLVSDVMVLESFPSTVLGYMDRMHRWVRGDWQLLPWLIQSLRSGKRERGQLTILGCWKILDNFRRSLLAPSLLLLFLSGWTWLPGSPVVWTAFGLIVLAAPIFLSALGGLRRFATARARIVLRGMGWSMRLELLRWFIALIVLPFEALVVSDAILRTLARLFVTRRNLLEWTTSAHSSQQLKKHSAILVWKRMWPVSFFAFSLFLLLMAFQPASLWAAAPLILFWTASPQFCSWLSRAPGVRKEPLSKGREMMLRIVARRTWLFFERFVGPEDHWLAPDHFQEDPKGVLARKTSPTNLAMMLLAGVAAYDLGYLGPAGFNARLQNAFENMAKLKRHRGHLLNWYETSSFRPLEPRYVSTVDSGNLAAALIAVKQSCGSVLDSSVLRPQQRRGILDTLWTFRKALEHLDSGELRRPVQALSDRLTELEGRLLETPDGSLWTMTVLELCEQMLPRCEELLVEVLDSGTGILTVSDLRELRIYSGLLHDSLLQTRRMIESIVPWNVMLRAPAALYADAETPSQLAEAWQGLQAALGKPPVLKRIPEMCRSGRILLEQVDHILDRMPPSELLSDAKKWNERLWAALDGSERTAVELISGLEQMQAQAETQFMEMDFSFLFDDQRQVFHLGYNLSAGRLDPNYYDLLASEARLTGLVAIAKGDVPFSHWVHLSRPFSRSNGMPVLLSWGGTMFEYLLPTLLMRTPRSTFLRQACESAVDQQISFAGKAGIPWGISESAYHQFDREFNYQYRAFGIPSLGLAQGLGERVVVAPYASCLGLPFRAGSVIKNLESLSQMDMVGPYGLYEAIDFGSRQATHRQAGQIVRSYMIHHQGMILTALSNFLTDDILKDRFHADPRICSVEPLMYEEIPSEVPGDDRWREKGYSTPARVRSGETNQWPVSLEHPCLQAQLLSNGRLNVLIAADGGGSCWRHELTLTRRGSDLTRSESGTWVYIRDSDTGEVWSATARPVPADSERNTVFFNPASARFTRSEKGIVTVMEVTVAPDTNTEIRRIQLRNETDQTRRLEVVSYGEVTLAPAKEYRRHPAYSKLFVESSFLPQEKALLFHRRPRSVKEKTIYLAHAIADSGAGFVNLAWETDRWRFLGRTGSLRSPRSLKKGLEGLSGSTGPILDPIMAMGCEVELPPYGEAEISFLTAAEEGRSETLDSLNRYRSSGRVARVFDQARRRSERELAVLKISPTQAQVFQELLSAILHPAPEWRAIIQTAGASRGLQSDLWKYGISGDLPIVLAKISSTADASFLFPLLQAQVWWRGNGLDIDVVVIQGEATSYAQPLRDRLRRFLEKASRASVELHGVFILSSEQMTEAELSSVKTAARLVVSPENGDLTSQLAELRISSPRLPAFVPMPSAPLVDKEIPALERPKDLLFDNGLGGFSPDGREYVIFLSEGRKSPAPWINVIANPDFGFLVSESGGGFTWAGNSAENRLTPWHNDPVQDPPGEVLYLRDEETGRIWSSTPSPAPASSPYLVRHGAGYSIFEVHSHGLEQQLILFADLIVPVKIVSLRLKNRWNRGRRLTATYYAEWVLGSLREVAAPFVIPEFDSELGAVFSSNSFHQGRDAGVAFLASDQSPHGMTGDRIEFLGRGGDLNQPEGLYRIGLAGRVQPGLDPCAALQIHIDLDPGESKEVHFFLGQANSQNDAVEVIQRFRSRETVRSSWNSVRTFWDDMLGAVEVETPDPAMDLLLNRWLLYQTVSCRLWARSAFYQSGGAYGFRDQLQDGMALVTVKPEWVRDHILEAARHQFPEGDVLHWWHPGSPLVRGVRTRCSDDLLWLPFATAHYVQCTGDESILDEEIPFLTGEILKKDELERYAEFSWGSQRASLYEHCWRAILKALQFGPHGLPLIGSGDWNDSLNRVGIGGKGESVWLGWFLYCVMREFSGLCLERGDRSRSGSLDEQAEKLRQTMEDSAWDGNWYRRAYFDNQMALGSAQNRECQIDLIAQAWAVLSGAGDPSRSSMAMQSAIERLVREEERLILLLTPPFDKTHWDPGYIQAYPPGVRENGGQYTHGAIWGVLALAQQGDGDRAGNLFRLLNPILRTARRTDLERYRVEPYVMAADVYGESPHVGKGGWTWYTGSSAWMYRLGLEALLGLRIRKNKIQIDPCIPRNWEEYRINLRHGTSQYRITIDNPEQVNRGVLEISADGVPVAGNEIPLYEDGKRHEIRVRMGKSVRQIKTD